MTRLHHHKGFSLIEMMTAMAIAGVISIMTINQTRLDNDRRQAKIIGQEMYQYNAAVGRFISASPAASTPATYRGAHWLRSSECYLGEATHHFLPCHYFVDGETARGSIGMETTISVSPSGEITARTVFDPIYDSLGRESTIMMDLAASVASAAGSQQGIMKGGSGIAYFCADTPGYSPAQKEICQDDTNRIVMYLTSSESIGFNIKSLIDKL